ncbi:MAG: hypothetical protein AB8B71_07755 [Paracoccaceae bacterium]
MTALGWLQTQRNAAWGGSGLSLQMRILVIGSVPQNGLSGKSCDAAQLPQAIRVALSVVIQGPIQIFAITEFC